MAPDKPPCPQHSPFTPQRLPIACILTGAPVTSSWGLSSCARAPMPLVQRSGLESGVTSCPRAEHEDIQDRSVTSTRPVCESATGGLGHPSAKMWGDSCLFSGPQSPDRMLAPPAPCTAGCTGICVQSQLRSRLQPEANVCSAFLRTKTASEVQRPRGLPGALCLAGTRSAVVWRDSEGLCEAERVFISAPASES